MSRMDQVLQVRSTLQSMRTMSEDISALDMCISGMEVVPPDLRHRREQAIQNQDALRRRYTQETADAMVSADILPRMERQVILLYYVAGKTMNQVAMEMHYSVRAVRRMKSSALDKLRGDNGAHGAV